MYRLRFYACYLLWALAFGAGPAWAGAVSYGNPQFCGNHPCPPLSANQTYDLDGDGLDDYVVVSDFDGDGTLETQDIRKAHDALRVWTGPIVDNDLESLQGASCDNGTLSCLKRNDGGSFISDGFKAGMTVQAAGFQPAQTGMIPYTYKVGADCDGGEADEPCIYRSDGGSFVADGFKAGDIICTFPVGPSASDYVDDYNNIEDCITKFTRVASVIASELELDLDDSDISAMEDAGTNVYYLIGDIIGLLSSADFTVDSINTDGDELVLSNVNGSEAILTEQTIKDGGGWVSEVRDVTVDVLPGSYTSDDTSDNLYGQVDIVSSDHITCRSGAVINGEDIDAVVRNGISAPRIVPMMGVRGASVTGCEINMNHSATSANSAGLMVKGFYNSDFSNLKIANTKHACVFNGWTERSSFKNIETTNCGNFSNIDGSSDTAACFYTFSDANYGTFGLTYGLNYESLRLRDCQAVAFDNYKTAATDYNGMHMFRDVTIDNTLGGCITMEGMNEVDIDGIDCRTAEGGVYISSGSGWTNDQSVSRHISVRNAVIRSHDGGAVTSKSQSLKIGAYTSDIQIDNYVVDRSSESASGCVLVIEPTRNLSVNNLTVNGCGGGDAIRFTDDAGWTQTIGEILPKKFTNVTIFNPHKESKLSTLGKAGVKLDGNINDLTFDGLTIAGSVQGINFSNNAYTGNRVTFTNFDVSGWEDDLVYYGTKAQILAAGIGACDQSMIGKQIIITDADGAADCDLVAGAVGTANRCYCDGGCQDLYNAGGPPQTSGTPDTNCDSDGSTHVEEWLDLGASTSNIACVSVPDVWTLNNFTMTNGVLRNCTYEDGINLNDSTISHAEFSNITGQTDRFTTGAGKMDSLINIDASAEFDDILIRNISCVDQANDWTAGCVVSSIAALPAGNKYETWLAPTSDIRTAGAPPAVAGNDVCTLGAHWTDLAGPSGATLYVCEDADAVGDAGDWIAK